MFSFKLSRKDATISLCAFILITIFIAVNSKSIKASISINPKYLTHKDSDIVIGSDNATITIVEYADFTCHHCSVFFQSHFDKIKKYTNDKKVKFVFRPLVISRHSLKAAQFLLCKKRSQEESEKILKVLFSMNISNKIDQYLKDLKKELTSNNINTNEFESCINSKQTLETVMSIRKEAIQDMQITATPFIVVDNVVAAPDHSIMFLIDTQLKKYQKNK
jgi:protein-disulfide isomerase